MINSVYALLKPDNFIQNTCKQSLHVLKGMGLELINYKIFKADSDILSEMYAKDFEKTLDFYTFNNRLFEFGPCIAMVFKTNTYTQESFSRMKGSAIPQRITDDTKIRKLMDAQTRIFNRIHIPLTFAQAQLEQSKIFKADFAKTRSYDMLTTELINCKYLQEFSNPTSLLTSVKFRILFAFEKRFSKKGQFLLSTWQQLLTHQNDFDLENNCLKELSSLTDDIIIRQVIDILQMMNKKTLTRPLYIMDYFWQCLSDLKIYISELERYYLTTYFIYPTI